MEFTPDLMIVAMQIKKSFDFNIYCAYYEKVNACRNENLGSSLCGVSEKVHLSEFIFNILTCSYLCE